MNIEKNIPIPVSYSGSKYPFKELEIGDSFLAPIEKRNSVNSNANHFGKNCNPRRKFITRTISELECRIWRTE